MCTVHSNNLSTMSLYKGEKHDVSVPLTVFCHVRRNTAINWRCSACVLFRVLYWTSGNFQILSKKTQDYYILQIDHIYI